MFFPVTHLQDMGVIKLMAPLRQHGMLDALIMRIRDQFDQLLLLQQLECGIDRLTAEIQLFAYLALGTGPLADQDKRPVFIDRQTAGFGELSIQAVQRAARIAKRAQCVQII